MSEMHMIYSVGGFSIVSAVGGMTLDAMKRPELARSLHMFTMTFLISSGSLYAISKANEMYHMLRVFGL